LSDIKVARLEYISVILIISGIVIIVPVTSRVKVYTRFVGKYVTGRR